MGLRPLANGHTETITVGDNGAACTYTLREMVSMADLERSSLLITELLTYTNRAVEVKKQIASGSSDAPFSEVERALKRAKKCGVDLMEMWMVSWSHSDPLTRENIERLEGEDSKAIYDYIGDRINGTKAEDTANPTAHPAPSGD